MLGNHRDAWGFGAVDPSSGTAQLIEVNSASQSKLKFTGCEKNGPRFMTEHQHYDQLGPILSFGPNWS